MKTLGNILLLGFAIILFTTSCSNEDTHQLSSGDINATEALRLTRVGQAESMEATFGGQKVTIEASDMISMQTMSAEDGDAQAVLNINQALMGTEKEAQLLDVKFSMADEPIENGMFIFGLETENSKDLTFEMFDEEGYALVAHNKFDINEGNNYKALNVSSFEEGIYNFRLKDNSGKELNRLVTIK